jgi:hypothetical protein
MDEIEVRADELQPGDRIVNGGTILGPAVDRRIPMNGDAIASWEVGYPVRYADGGEAIRIIAKATTVRIVRG